MLIGHLPQAGHRLDFMELMVLWWGTSLQWEEGTLSNWLLGGTWKENWIGERLGIAFRVEALGQWSRQRAGMVGGKEGRGAGRVGWSLTLGI